MAAVGWAAETAADAQPLPSDAELEASGAVIGEILIDNRNVFDPRDPKDNNGLFRTANRLHVTTRPEVIRHQLLFHTGDPYSRHALEESERTLRTNGYLYDASVVPVSYHEGRVDVRITTRDLWTLNPGIDFEREGGANSAGFVLEEDNLLGTGTSALLSRTSTIDRSGTTIAASNAHAFGTWTSLGASYSDNSDGDAVQVIVEHPFYSLDTRHAGGLNVTDYDQTDSLYDRGAIINQFHDTHHFVESYFGWSHGLQDGWVRRWRAGVTYDEHLFNPLASWTGPTLVPEDRKFAYPWVEFDLLQDSYAKLRNHDQISRTEDFYCGATTMVRAGWASASLGSSRSAMLFQSSAGTGRGCQGPSTLLLSGAFSGRIEGGALRDGVLSGALRYYWQQNSQWLLFTTIQGTKGWQLDLDHQILLGGDSGLRGYPLRYQDGTARGLATIEERYFSNWYVFRIFRIGAAAFVDAGRTWGAAPLAQPSLGVLTDAGFGLRVASSRWTLGGIVHIDLAFPFNGDSSIKRVQFLVQTQQQF